MGHPESFINCGGEDIFLLVLEILKQQTEDGKSYVKFI